jgi:hypothetical protein
MANNASAPDPSQVTFNSAVGPSLADLAAQNAALLASAQAAGAASKAATAQASSNQAATIADNTALAKTLGATVDPATGKITPPSGGYTAPGLAAAAGLSSSGSSGTSGTTTTNAAQQLSALLSGYGLTGNIGGGITAMLASGLDMTTVLNIIDSPNPSAQIGSLGLTPSQLSAANGLITSWQQRFSGNQARIAAGLNPLDPATYIANEQSYKQVMTMAGIPASSPLMSSDYLGKLMGTDVSPAEVQMRVNAATAAVQNEDPQVLAQLQSQFGMTMPTILSHLLDPSVAAPLVQQEYNAATIGAEAARAGVSIAYGATGPLSAMGLAAQGITQSQANQGFTSIAQQQAAMQSLAGRYQGYGNAAGVGQQLEASTFNTAGAAQAQQNLERLKTQEVSAFSGSAGAATGSLGAKDISGLS